MKKVLFGTTNEGKLSEARDILGIEIEGVNLVVDEVQSLDPFEVVTKKALAYYQIIKKPILVEDTSLTFTALKKLPGTLVDQFYKTLGNEGMVNLLKGHKNRNALAEVLLAYVGSNGKVTTFRGHTRGRIAVKPKGTKGFGWDPIFIPGRQGKTFGEMELDEKNKYSMRKRAFIEFAKDMLK